VVGRANEKPGGGRSIDGKLPEKGGGSYYLHRGGNERVVMHKNRPHLERGGKSIRTGDTKGG